MPLVRNAFQVIRENRRAYAVINVSFYGLIVIVMIITAIVPHLQSQLTAAATPSLYGPGVAGTAKAAYDSGNVARAATVTFLVNLCVAALGTITLPSLAVPFFGVIFGVFRTILWGVLFSPVDGHIVAALPHFLTLIIEGQAYLLAIFAAWVHARKWLSPARFGLRTHAEGYRSGLYDIWRLYPLVIICLIVGAVYEAFEVIYLP